MLSPQENTLLAKKLRACQREAISKVSEYLSRELSGKSMLVCLPTGAGKTGVIAVVCQARSAGATLVLSPRRAVCDQLRDQVGGKFFRDRGVSVTALNPVGIVGSKIKIAKGSIIIDTFQKLVLMSEMEREKYLSLFDLVIVDEGHSEPAPIWGRIVRSMACRKVIVTATPYRNDLFQFDIGEINYCFTLKRAIQAGDVLEPEFASARLDSLVDDVRQWLEENPSQKCIIKCENFSDVLGHLRNFNEHGMCALAFHDQFGSSDEQGGMVHVPRDVAKRAERVLIHQHKLDEGVDIPTAKLLVLTYAVSNGRELVQSTGRIVRKTEGFPRVWDCAGGSNEAIWENYRNFDSYISDDESWRLFLNSLDSATLIDAYLAAFPRMSYHGQTFRSTFDLESFDPEEQLKLPLASFCFMEVEGAFAMPSFLDSLLWDMRGRGELAKLCPSAFDLHVIVSIAFDNSNFLRDELFFQPRIEVIVAKKIGARLAIFDSRSVDHSSRKELKTGRPIDVTSMLKLASRDQSRRTRETHARAVGTTRRRPDGVSQRGRDLEGVIATQANSSYALSIAKVDNLDAKNKRTTSYYLGVGSGRVSDQKLRNFSLESISSWIDEIAGVMDSKMNSVTGLLSSFSLPISDATSASVLSIIVDLSNLDSDISVISGRRKIDISPGFHFAKVSGERLSLAGVRLSLNRNADDGFIKFSAPTDLVLASDVEDAPAGSDFVEWLNRQSFKALLEGGISYLDGNYYSVALPSQQGFKLKESVLGRQFISIKELQTAGLTEKGAPERSGFAANSVFRILDDLRFPAKEDDSSGIRRIKGELIDVDVVLCTDMGTEAADFIFSSPHKLIYVHAKCGGSLRPRSSAGALAEVGSQALKNVEQLISKDLTLKFGNESRLKEIWPDANSATGFTRLRSFKDEEGQEKPRSGNGDGDLIDGALRLLRSRRRSDLCEKEIWIVVGRAFSLESFNLQLAKGSMASPESLQALQLVNGWSGTARDSDIALRFIVSP